MVSPTINQRQTVAIYHLRFIQIYDQCYNPDINLSSSGNSPVAFFDQTNLPSTITSNTPPADGINWASAPSFCCMFAAKLAA